MVVGVLSVWVVVGVTLTLGDGWGTLSLGGGWCTLSLGGSRDDFFNDGCNYHSWSMETSDVPC